MRQPLVALLSLGHWGAWAWYSLRVISAWGWDSVSILLL